MLNNLFYRAPLAQGNNSTSTSNTTLNESNLTMAPTTPPPASPFSPVSDKGVAPPAPSAAPPDDKTVERLAEKLDVALDRLKKAKPFAKTAHQTDVFQMAGLLLKTDAGMNALWKRAHRFDEAGVFYSGAWETPGNLRAEFIKGSLKVNGIYPVLEMLSELRVLAIAKGYATHESMTAEEATIFLNQAVALNLEFLFPEETEASRVEASTHQEEVERLFRLLSEHLSLSSIRTDIVEEIDQICAQRPILTKRLRKMIEVAGRIPHDTAHPDESDKLNKYVQAISGASPLSQKYTGFAAYRDALKELDTDALEAEADFFADAMRSTGLDSPHHAILIRFLERQHPKLLSRALGLNSAGQAELKDNEAFARQLIRVAILPSAYRAIYGFAGVLERSLLSRTDIEGGLKRLIELDLCSNVRKNLLAQRETHDGVTANSILVAGVLMVLGQPLGVGQGKNPTCQSARGISFWSQHTPSYLLNLLISAARDEFVEIPLEGVPVNSTGLKGGLVTEFDMELDPVSIVLVPHLDKIYDEMMCKVALRPEDGHKYVNPAMYGRIVPSGFASLFDKTSLNIINFEDFIRRFYATHHPAYNNGHKMIHPNPVGLMITNAHGEKLGAHAVLLQRIQDDTHGKLRAYFYNPNNEGRQAWGQGIQPSVSGFGELEGESSLPFHEFASRLYAFHYNPYEEGDAFAVPDASIAEIRTLVEESWGKVHEWQ